MPPTEDELPWVERSSGEYPLALQASVANLNVADHEALRACAQERHQVEVAR